MEILMRLEIGRETLKGLLMDLLTGLYLEIQMRMEKQKVKPMEIQKRLGSGKVKRLEIQKEIQKD